MTEGDTMISGVFFHQNIQAEGQKLGLVGWVQITDEVCYKDH
jgi:acylphosphatase